MDKKYQAYTQDCRVTANSPREAAELFFKRFPRKRKCSIIEGVTDGYFFTTAFGKATYSVHDITKKSIPTLPTS